MQSADLQFKPGNLYFLLGKSGAGKSTFIEALGLMTNTFKEKDEVYFIDHNDSKINLPELWQNSDERLSGFRRKHYSFIFQNTNLMENFTAGQNMTFTLMLAGQTWENSKLQVLDLMKQLDLPEEVFDKNVMNVSGGQRQRIAFVRALTAPHSIIFCDEPTGNLDEVVAHKLMGQLKSMVKDKNKTAIVVSHDIKLATAFADEILCATIDSESGIGRIQNEDIVLSAGELWKTNEGSIIEDIHDYLLKKLI